MYLKQDKHKEKPRKRQIKTYMPTQDICRENSHGEAAAAQLTKWLTVSHTFKHTHTRKFTDPLQLSTPPSCMRSFFSVPHSRLFLVKSLLSTASNHFQNKDCVSNTIGKKILSQQITEGVYMDKCNCGRLSIPLRVHREFRIVKGFYSTYLWNHMEKYIL